MELNQLQNEQSLSMFFDNDFNPANYVDALFQSIVPSTNPQANYSIKNLNSVSNNVSNFITHLDYYTNELSKDVSLQIDTLKLSSQSLIKNEDIANPSDLSKLQYYINSFNNSILSLQTEIDNFKIASTDNKTDNEAVNNLIKLKLVRENLIKVLTIIERANIILKPETTSKFNSITSKDFHDSLLRLFDGLKSQLDNTPKDTDLLQNIDDLIDLLPVFNNLNEFYPIYRKFVTRLVNEREQYK